MRQKKKKREKTEDKVGQEKTDSTLFIHLIKHYFLTMDQEISKLPMNIKSQNPSHNSVSLVVLIFLFCCCGNGGL